VNYTLGTTKFYIDKVFNRIVWQAWAMVGIGLGQVEGMRKLELYPCDATPGSDAQGMIGYVTAMAEQDLGAINNRIDDGLVYPKISQY
jgi:hypothetical protein